MAELYREEIVRVDLGSPLRRYSVGKVLATGDDRANRFGAEVFRRGAAVSLDGGKVNGYFIPPEGEALLLDGSATGNTAYVELHGACYAQEGRFSLAVKVTADGVTTTLCVFDGWIVATSTDEVRDPGGIVPSLDDILEKIADMEQATEDAEAAADAANMAAEGITGTFSELEGIIDTHAASMPDELRGGTAYYHVSWEQGAISNNDGSESDSATRIRSDYLPVGRGIRGTLTADNGGVCYWVRVYDADKTFLGNGQLSLSGNIIVGTGCNSYPVNVDAAVNAYPDAAYIRLAARQTDSSATILPGQNGMAFMAYYAAALNGRSLDEVYVRRNVLTEEDAAIIRQTFADVTDDYAYQWEYSTNGGTSWMNSGAEGNATSAIVLSLKNYYDGYLFRCRITDRNGIVIARTPVATAHVGDGVNKHAAQAALHAGVFCLISDTDIHGAAGSTYTLTAGVRTVSREARRSGYALYGDFSTLYETPDREAAPDLATMQSADVYALYDELAAQYPGTVTRNLLGYSGDADGNAVESLPIYEYVINSRSAANFDGSAMPVMPTVMLTTGTHAGTEKLAVWCAYLMIRDMLTGADRSLSAIRSNVELRMVPLVCPWAFDAGTRANARGVNINRNFSYAWDSASSDTESTEYRGDAPYSELETQAVKAWIDAHPDALILIDLHNCFADGEYAWACSIDADSARVFAPYARLMSDYLCSIYAISNEDNLFRLSAAEKHPGVADEAGVAGISRHCCLESNIKGFGGAAYNARAVELGVSVLTNYILAIMDREAKA